MLYVHAFIQFNKCTNNFFLLFDFMSFSCLHVYPTCLLAFMKSAYSQILLRVKKWLLVNDVCRLIVFDVVSCCLQLSSQPQLQLPSVLQAKFNVQVEHCAKNADLVLAVHLWPESVGQHINRSQDIYQPAPGSKQVGAPRVSILTSLPCISTLNLSCELRTCLSLMQSSAKTNEYHGSLV